MDTKVSSEKVRYAKALWWLVKGWFDMFALWHL